MSPVGSSFEILVVDAILVGLVGVALLGSMD